MCLLHCLAIVVLFFLLKLLLVITRTREYARPILVSLEGNIGAGKSTLLEKMKKLDGVEVCLEPISIWREYGMLEARYNKLEYFAWFQLTVCLFLKHVYQQTLKTARRNCKVIIFERSVYSSGQLFSQFGNLSESFYTIAEEIMNDCPIDLFLYLDTPPSTCLTHIKKRNRFEEQSLDFEFLKDLENKTRRYLRFKKFQTINLSMSEQEILNVINMYFSIP